MSTISEPNTVSKAAKYLTFALGEESYGIEVLKIREIIRMQKITPVPHMPHYSKGVINLRGKVIPVIDMRIKFNLEPGNESERTCIVVVLVKFENDAESLVGLIVDAVEEVSSINQNQIEDNPEIGNATDSNFVIGIAKIDAEIKTLLDIDLLIGGDSLSGF